MAKQLSIFPVVTDSQHLIQLEPINPDVEWFYMFDGLAESLLAAKDLTVVAEFPAAYFRRMLVLLDGKLDQVIKEEVIPNPQIELMEKFGMLQSREYAEAVIHYWSETYLIFHPEAKEK